MAGRLARRGMRLGSSGGGSRGSWAMQDGRTQEPSPFRNLPTSAVDGSDGVSEMAETGGAILVDVHGRRNFFGPQ